MMIKVGMMIQNDTVGVVGRVIYVDARTAVVQEFMGTVHELNPYNCEEVNSWVRLRALTIIAKKLVSFFARRITK